MDQEKESSEEGKRSMKVGKERGLEEEEEKKPRTNVDFSVILLSIFKNSFFVETMSPSQSI